MQPELSGFFDAWALFRDPTLTGTLAGGLLGLLGVYVVLRRMVFLSAALSQAAGLGVVSAWYSQLHWGLAVNPTVGAALFTLAGAAALSSRDPRRQQGRDGVLGLVFLLGAAGTLAIGTRIVQEVQDIQGILFGSAVAVAPDDLQLVAWLTAGLGCLHLWWQRGITLTVVDPEGARVRGLPVPLLEATLWLSLALAVSVGTRVLGALPVFAWTVLPPWAALRLAPNVPWALATAALLGAASGFAGYVLAYLWQLPVGAAQTLVAIGFCLVAWLFDLVRTRWPSHARATHGPAHGPAHDHAHQHGPDCGHEAIPHGDHVDYLVEGHLHHPHDDHCDDHGPP
jgi:zinc transport system permease protein